MKKPASNESGKFSGFSLLMLGVFALSCVGIASVMLGSSHIALSNIFSDAEARLIVLDIRLPRFLFASLVGAALAVIGVAYQTIFRNPLASPFTLGVSSGAALGASLSMLLRSSGLSLEMGAIVGSAVSIFLIKVLSSRMRGEAGGALLLVGIIFSFFCSSVLTMAQYLSDYSQLFRVTRWMMGGIPVVGMKDILIGAVLLSILVVWAIRNHRAFDLMLFGDEFATVKGVEVKKLYDTTFVLSSIVIGWIVSQCGVIGFVGIVVPAMARILVGLPHRYVVPLAAVGGGLLVSSCDLLGRVVRPPFEVPAGVFTAVLGGPVFIALAMRSRNRTLL
jgi:iron complex transport system permease protein